MTKISCYHGARLGWGFQADLTSSQGSVWWATRDPGVWSRIVVGGGALLSAEHPLLCLSPPLLTTLHTDARGYRTYGDQLTGKRRQRAQPRGRLCVRRHPALPPDRLSVGITVGGAWAYPFFLAEFSNFSWKLLRRSCFSPNHFIKVVWCRLFRADQVVETSAPLSWISSLPKSGMFSPGK